MIDTQHMPTRICTGLVEFTALSSFLSSSEGAEVLEWLRAQIPPAETMAEVNFLLASIEFIEAQIDDNNQPKPQSIAEAKVYAAARLEAKAKAMLQGQAKWQEAQGQGAQSP